MSKWRMGELTDICDIIEVLGNVEHIEDSRLYFTRKRSGTVYDSFSPSVDTSVTNKLVSLISENLEKQKDLPINVFSPIGSYDDSLECCQISEIENFMYVAQSFEEDKVERENIPSEIIGKLNFYCFSIDYKKENELKNVKFFRRLTKFKKLSSRGIFGQIKNNRFSKIESDMLGVDGDVDLIVLDAKVLILNHVALERIFSVSDQYIEKSKEAISKIREAGRIKNFEQFEEDCQNNARITRILTKLLGEEDRLEHCFQNFSNVKKAIKIFELDIKTETIRGKEQIVYERKDQLMDMVRLVRDSYYKSIIQGRNGVDDSL